MKWGEYSSDVQFILQRSDTVLQQSQQQIARQQQLRNKESDANENVGIDKSRETRKSINLG